MTRILIVDDEPANLRLLEDLLRLEGYADIGTTTTGEDVPAICQRGEVDLVLLDLRMPEVDGFTVLERLREILPPDAYLPVLVLTADVDKESRRRALALGAQDFITKPFDTVEVVLRIRNLLETRRLHLELKQYGTNLESIVMARTSDLWNAVTKLERSEHDLRLAQEETIERLAVAAEMRDIETGDHIRRMSELCGAVAASLGENAERCDLLRIASQLHDVGKIGTPDEILLKPGRLTPGERSVMEQHAEIGYEILRGSSSEVLKVAATIALTHHERYDGSGYPRGLRGNEIPIEGRIAAVADVFDALTSDRVYRKAIPRPQAVAMMEAGRGTQFDAEVLDAFLAHGTSDPRVNKDLTSSN